MKNKILLVVTLTALSFACEDSNSPENKAGNSSNQIIEGKTSNSSVQNSGTSSTSQSKRAAPSDLTGEVDQSDPSGKINISWKRNAADNSFVEIFLDGKYVANVPGSQTTYQFKDLAPGRTYKIKVWNFWKQGDVSAFSNEVSLATAGK